MLIVHRTTRIERRSEPCPFTPLKPSQPDLGRHIQEHHKVELRDQSIAPACKGPGQHPSVRRRYCFRKQADPLRCRPLFLERWRGWMPVEIVEVEVLTSQTLRERPCQRRRATTRCAEDVNAF